MIAPQPAELWEHFRLYFNNYKSYGETEMTAGSSASNRSRKTLPRNSNGSCGLLYVKKGWVEFFPRGIRDAFACNPTTKGAMAKWRSRLDLSRQIGLKTPLTPLLIVVEDCYL